MEDISIFVSSILLVVVYHNRKLSTRLYPVSNPIEQVKSTCRTVVCESSHVFIDATTLQKVALELGGGKDIKAIINGVRWDENDWHYCADAKIAGPKTCQYVFVLDSLNFCFWPDSDNHLEYDYLATALKDAFLKDEENFSAEFLSIINEEVLQAWFPKYRLPLLSERVQRLRELGAVLIEKFQGFAENVVLAANKSAVSLVRIIIENFPGKRFCLLD